MEYLSSAGMEFNNSRESAGHENDLRFCGKNVEKIYEAVFEILKEESLIINMSNFGKEAEKVSGKEKYDCIVLDDILHLVDKFGREQQIADFLKKCMEGLNQGGRLIIRTANRIGAQYLSGKSDDYTGSYFDGINNYRNSAGQKSFTKKELERILLKSGVRFQKFFYPYPNQNYVKELFTEGSFRQFGYGRPYINLAEGKFNLFDETGFYHTLVEEGVIKTFANGFFIVASANEQKSVENIQYVKLNWDREERFQIATVLKNDGVVEKYALNEKAEKHIQQIYENQDIKLGESISNLQGRYEEKKLIYPVLKDKNLDMLIAAEIERKDRDEILSIFNGFYKKLLEGSELRNDYYTDQFREVFGSAAGFKTYHCTAPVNIDLICDNVFRRGDQYEIIDCEWNFDFFIPVEFVIWRAINELYSRHGQLSGLINRKDFMKEFSIEEDDERLFLKWGSYFAYEYVKSDGVRKREYEEVPLSLNEIYALRQREQDANGICMNRRFEFDIGNGFEEQCVLYAEIDKEGDTFSVFVNIPEKYKGKLIRWKAAPEHVFRIRMQKLEGAEIVGHNAYSVERESYFFIFGDAFFYFYPKTEDDMIRIEGELTELDIREQREVFRKKQEQEEKERQKRETAERERCEKVRMALEQQLADSNEELKRFKDDNLRLQSDLDSVLNSTIWRKTEPFRRLKDGRREKKTEASAQVLEEQPENETKREMETASKEQTLAELVRFCIDSIILSEDMMSVDGWVLCEKHRIDEAYLVLKDVFNIRREYPFHLCERKDVAEALSMQIEGDCGIHIAANYRSYCEQKLSLKILVNEEWLEIDTGRSIPRTKNTEEGDFFLERNEERADFPDYNECRMSYVGGMDCPDTEDWQVDVIVPVYNGMQYLPGLFKSMERTKVFYRLILIEDCSTDASVRPYLQKYAAEHENVVLLENGENLGFVKSVNRALRMAENHAALVNTDVVLPENWLERLMAPIFADENVASATPFTNSATIYSFPDFDKDNALFMGLSVDEIDREFARLIPRYVEAPTGVGFCMGMNIHAMKKIGILDEETFEKGYGEENDWCQRAIEAGYKNVYVENLFVHHNHGGSFPSETKKRLIAENGAKLLKKHPNYSADVAKFARKDPNRRLRSFVKFDIMFHYNAPCILAFDHNLGGGASDYLKQKKQEQILEGRLFGIVRYDLANDNYLMEIYFGGYESKVLFRTRERVVELLKQRSYEQIWINELATYPEIENWIKAIEELREQKGVNLRLLIHDYFMVCPSLNLMSAEGKYCRLPEDEVLCNECLKDNDFSYSNECISLSRWRKVWGKLIRKCDEVIAFSEDSVRILKKIYSDVTSVQLIPHVVEPLEEIKREKKTTRTYNIGVLGAISEQKGLKVIKRMLEYIMEKHLDMRIVIIGQSSEKIDSPAFSITGRYVREEIPRLTIENDIDVFLIPSVWPETFSYTTSEIMSMNMPIAVFDLGAPAERVKDYDKGLILPDTGMSTKELVETLYEFAGKQVENIDS